MKKKYIIDTNILIDNPKCIEILRNGIENEIIIPFHVLLELDNLKKESSINHLVTRALEEIEKNKEYITVLKKSENSRLTEQSIDLKILKEIELLSNIDDYTLVTNDRLFSIIASGSGLKTESFKESIPFKTISEEYTGLLSEKDEKVKNSFIRKIDGSIVFVNKYLEESSMKHTNVVWGVTPNSLEQNCALEIMLNTDINLCSIQSVAGMGKTYLALAAGMQQTLQKKNDNKLYSKIYFIKSTDTIEDMGYLPGDIKDKMEPFINYAKRLTIKLHEQRQANRLFFDPNSRNIEFNPQYFEILPLSYIRGMNIDNSFVIIDEIQNISRNILRSLLSRMGKNVKCVMLGDVHQIDNHRLNTKNNGMNWAVNKFKNSDIYSHLVLKGKKSRGPICDLVHSAGL